ncbi:MAG: hypothetical protein R3C56_40685 [Pirellulaceae bacterium]
MAMKRYRNKNGKTGLLAGFDMLDAMGKIKDQVGRSMSILADQYVKISLNGKSSLVVAPTRGSGEVTHEIRERLKKNHTIATEERAFLQLKGLNLSEAEKESNVATYKEQVGLIVQFHQNIQGGIQRGDRCRVVGTTNHNVQLERMSDQSPMLLPRDHADRFEVYAENEIRLAVTKFASHLAAPQDGTGRISNGRLDEIKGFDDSGNIQLKNGWTIDKDQSPRSRLCRDQPRQPG